MKTQITTVEKLYNELERERASRQDLIADTRSLNVNTKNGVSTLLVLKDGDTLSYPISELAHRQIADRLKIPFAYYDRMRMEAPELLDTNINNWLYHNAEQRMLRTLDGKLRAFLSARYHRLDHLELMNAIMPTLQEMKGATIESMGITETHLYIKVINKTMRSEVVPGDVVQSGFVISNSEVGKGAINVSPLIYRLVCKNGMIINELGNKKYHIGRSVEDADSAYELYSDETMALDDAAYFSKAADAVRAAADMTKFELIVDRLRQATEIDTGANPIKTVEVLADRYVLNAQEKASVLMHFLRSGDSSLYGLTNAVTRAGQDVADYGRATELEKIGGTLLNEGIATGKQSKKALTRELLAA